MQLKLFDFASGGRRLAKVADGSGRARGCITRLFQMPLEGDGLPRVPRQIGMTGRGRAASAANTICSLDREREFYTYVACLRVRPCMCVSVNSRRTHARGLGRALPD